MGSSEVTLGIGSALWHYNDSCYNKEAKKRWVSLTIWGETTRSWLIGNEWQPIKLAKSLFKDGACPRGWALSEEQVEQHAWVEDSRWRIGDRVQRCDNYAILKAIEALLEP